jgi:hypothetical protein
MLLFRLVGSSFKDGEEAEPQIASVPSIGMIPSFSAFLVSPIVDWRVTRRAYAGAFALLAVAAGVHIASAVPSFSAILCRREDGPHGRHSVNQARVPIVLARCGERRELRVRRSRRSAHPASRRHELLEYVH